MWNELACDITATRRIDGRLLGDRRRVTTQTTQTMGHVFGVEVARQGPEKAGLLDFGKGPPLLAGVPDP